MILNEYRTNMRGLIIKSVLIGFPLAVLCGVPFFGTEFAFLGIIISGILIPGAFVAYVLSNKLIIRINQEDIDFIWGFKPIQTVPLANNTFTTYTHKLRLWYVFVITTRYLRVTGDSGEQKDYSCSGLSQKQFEEFISEVIHISNEKRRQISREQANTSLPETGVDAAVAGPFDGMPGTVPYATETAEHRFTGATFDFPRESFQKQISKSLKKDFIIVGSIALFLLIFNPGTLMFFLTGDFTELKAVLIGAPIFLIIFAAILCPMWLQFKYQLKRTPGQITISERELIIDDQRFLLPDIMSVKMTQENFIPQDQRRFRTMNITSDGKTYKYLIYHMLPGKKRICYHDYERLCDSLNDFLKARCLYIIYETT